MRLDRQLLSLAGFLCGMGNNTFFGGGVEWGDVTNWMQPHSDYGRPLGRPLGPAKRNPQQNGSGFVYTRTFESGTTVFHQTSPLASCIRWADGATSGMHC